MGLILRFDVLRTEVLWMVNIGQKYQKGNNLEKRAKIENPYLNAYLHINTNSHIYKVSKGEVTEGKRAKIENPYLNVHLHITMNSHIYFQENPSRGLGGVAITNFF